MWEGHSTSRCTLRLAALFCGLLRAFLNLPLASSYSQPHVSPLQASESTKFPSTLAHKCPISHHQRYPVRLQLPTGAGRTGQRTVCLCIHQVPLQLSSWHQLPPQASKSSRDCLPLCPRAKVIEGYSAYPSRTHPLTPPRC